MNQSFLALPWFHAVLFLLSYQEDQSTLVGQGNPKNFSIIYSVQQSIVCINTCNPGGPWEPLSPGDPFAPFSPVCNRTYIDKRLNYFEISRCTSHSRWAWLSSLSRLSRWTRLSHLIFKYCQILFSCTSDSLPFLEDPFLLVDPVDLQLQDFHRLLGHPFLLKLQVNHGDQANPRI